MAKGHLVLVSAVLLFRNTGVYVNELPGQNVNCPRGGDKINVKSPPRVWGVGGWGMKLTSAL